MVPVRVRLSWERSTLVTRGSPGSPSGPTFSALLPNRDGKAGSGGLGPPGLGEWRVKFLDSNVIAPLGAVSECPIPQKPFKCRVRVRRRRTGVTA